MYGTVYHSLHHIVASVFHFGCLQRTYSRLQILSGCSDVTTFNLISTGVESKSDSFLYLWLFILFTFYNYTRVLWSMHGIWISVTGRFSVVHTRRENSITMPQWETVWIRCWWAGLNGLFKQVLDTRVNLLIVLPAVWPACCFAHGASFSSSTRASLSQCPISAVNSCQGRPGLMGKTVSSADRI